MNEYQSMQALTAPRMRTRRLARVYFFPWAQWVGAVFLFLFGWRSRIYTPALLIYGIVIFLVCTVEDLAAPQSRIMRVLCLAQNAWRKVQQKPQPNRKHINNTQFFFTCAPPPLFVYRHTIRWPVSLFSLLATWAFAWVQAALFPTKALTAQLTFTFSLFALGLIPYAMFIIAPIPGLRPLIRRWVWYALAASGPLMALFSLWSVTADARIILFAMALFFLLYATIFAIQRLWVGQRAWNNITRNISRECLTWFEASQKLDHIPEILVTRLKLDRVFILKPTPDEQHLQVEAEFGDYPSVKHRQVPISQSLTGRAFQEKQSVVWNNVRECPYYVSLCNDDDTRAEIAVPIIYHSQVYGILDAQSKVKGAYSPNDLAALQTIASILGAAIAVDKREQFFHDAVQMWQHVMAAKRALTTERDIFDVFAEFAQKQIGADLIIYFPLSLAGYPVRPPFTYGQFNRPDLIRSPTNDPHSSLIQLVAEWEPYFESRVTAESLVTRFSPPSSPGFVERETVYATCFLPVGTHQERLGALFLNFRQPKRFDDSFRFTVLSLAQSLAQAAAQVRYRDVVYKSFGRPEINVHSIISRYGFKQGVMAHAKGLHAGNNDAEHCPDITSCPLHPLVNQMDDLVTEMRLAESARPPDFWEETLERQLEIFKSALPNLEGGRRPRLKLDIDDSIEKEYPLVKLALYRVITESISNAIIHGDASRIEVSVRRLPTAIEAQIINNGYPLPENAENNKGTNGIYMLLHECNVKLGANAHIANQQDGPGVIVSTSIPALP